MSFLKIEDLEVGKKYDIYDSKDKLLQRNALITKIFTEGRLSLASYKSPDGPGTFTSGQGVKFKPVVSMNTIATIGASEGWTPELTAKMSQFLRPTGDLPTGYPINYSAEEQADARAGIIKDRELLEVGKTYTIYDAGSGVLVSENVVIINKYTNSDGAIEIDFRRQDGSTGSIAGDTYKFKPSEKKGGRKIKKRKTKKRVSKNRKHTSRK